MAKSSASGRGEFEHHIVGVRGRILGEGDMLFSLEDYSAIQTSNLTALTMSTATRFEPTVLSNFQSQRTRLIGTVAEIDEWFDVSRLVIWIKPVAIEYPM